MPERAVHLKCRCICIWAIVVHFLDLLLLKRVFTRMNRHQTRILERLRRPCKWVCKHLQICVCHLPAVWSLRRFAKHWPSCKKLDPNKLFSELFKRPLQNYAGKCNTGKFRNNSLKLKNCRISGETPAIWIRPGTLNTLHIWRGQKFNPKLFFSDYTRNSAPELQTRSYLLQIS